MRNDHSNENQINNEYQENQLLINKDLAFGPVEKRSIKDFMMIIVYTLFMVLLFQVGSDVIQKGDPRKLQQPFDSDGVQCGFNDAQNFSQLYFLNPSKLGSSYYICVDECPTNKEQVILCKTNSQVLMCSDLNYYRSVSFLNICLPLDQDDQNQNIQNLFQTSKLQKIIIDLKITYPVIIGVTIFAFFISLIFMMIVRKCAGIITWMMVFLTFFFILLLSYLFINDDKQFIINVSDLSNNKENLKIVGYSLFGLSILYFLVLLCYKTKIQEAIIVIKASAKFTQEVYSSILIPLSFSLIVASFFILWTTICFYILTQKEIKKNQLTPFGQVEWDENMRNQFLLFLFGFFWNCEIAQGLNQLIVSSACSIWYFQYHPTNILKQQQHNSITKSIYRTFAYHFGSVLLGSLLIALIETFRVVLESFYKSIKKQMVGENQIANCVYQCFSCFVECFQRFIQFISTNTYILIALKGNSFCEAAKDAFCLVVRNVGDFQVMHGIGKVFSFIGKIFVATTMAVLGYLIMSNSEYNNKIYSPIAPSIVIFILSFIVSQLFMNVFSMAGDTLLVCLTLDRDLNQGKAKSVPPHLQKFYDEYI